MARSRLSKRIQQKTKKNFILSVLGIILIILLVLKFGIPLLVNFSVLISGSQNKDEAKIPNPSFIAPPVLDSFPQATSSGNIVISGIDSKNQKINLYINDVLIDTVKTQDDGKFSFKESINPGDSIIKAKAVVNEKESDFSNTVTTSFKNAPPSLNINFPSDNQAFSKDQNVVGIKGTTDPDVKITINGLWAITDSLGKFSYNLTLQSGENKVTIIEQDTAGNQAKKEIKVNSSQ